ncbi:peptidylprolyl isomerase [Thermomonospora umbrina]|uniref:Peptidyl-prolyl cis-trans isomerase B (Cyclophilin B) n=1 Tax=Thermomonospora umbrina TaxID=111806 RepID=A0A3D9SSI4_9ACTN|nr:peptidylprolyl isomerase [Thermomonospora umbrina]REE94671.1 peptidyl-prolyl cis-trans isomerase B (cyclophilin B) [Thermomonospora umbrina]
MAGKDRKKQLAKQRYERQQARRAAEARQARRVRVVGSAVAVAVIAGGGAGIVALVGGDDGAKAGTNADPTPTGPPPTDGAPKQAISLTKVDLKTDADGGTAECKYHDSQDDQNPPKGLDKPPATAAHTGKVKATIKTTLGNVGVELDAAKAPCTVNSFAHLAKEKFFEKSKCHRLTTGGLAVLQCGDPTGTGMGGPGYRFANENTKGAKYTRGVLAMAHSTQPDSNGSQFFIVYKDSQLPADYTIFGKITSGMDVIDKVAGAGVAAQ